MKKIDIADWKEFQIGELFNIEKGTRLTKANMQNGNIKFIGASASNNGVTAFIGNREHLHPSNTITVSYNGSVGEAFYQPDSFWASDDVNVLYPKFNLNKYIAMFVIPILKLKGKQYAFIDKWKKEDMEKDTIPLPVTHKGKPDWEYMENFISKMTEQQSSNIRELIKITPPIYRNNLNIKTRRFHLYDIFQIDMGTKLDKINMQTDNPEVDFVGRANENQGVTAKVNRIDGIQPYKAGNFTLALGGALGSCFIQRNNFYTSQNVIVLTPKEDISIEAKLYLSSVIFKESQLGYKAFLNELNPHIKTDFSIPLPITETDKPNWQFMGDYIKTITTLQSKNIQVIRSISC